MRTQSEKPDLNLDVFRTIFARKWEIIFQVSIYLTHFPVRTLLILFYTCFIYLSCHGQTFSNIHKIARVGKLDGKKKLPRICRFFIAHPLRCDVTTPRCLGHFWEWGPPSDLSSDNSILFITTHEHSIEWSSSSQPPLTLLGLYGEAESYGKLMLSMRKNQPRNATIFTLSVSDRIRKIASCV